MTVQFAHSAHFLPPDASVAIPNSDVAMRTLHLATFEAWQLSLWYQELALLYLLDHDGDYRNRMAAEAVGDVDKVPWQ